MKAQRATVAQLPLSFSQCAKNKPAQHRHIATGNINCNHYFCNMLSISHHAALTLERLQELDINMEYDKDTVPWTFFLNSSQQLRNKLH